MKFLRKMFTKWGWIKEKKVETKSDFFDDFYRMEEKKNIPTGLDNQASIKPAAEVRVVVATPKHSYQPTTKIVLPKKSAPHVEPVKQATIVREQVKRQPTTKVVNNTTVVYEDDDSSFLDNVVTGIVVESILESTFDSSPSYESTSYDSTPDTDWSGGGGGFSGGGSSDDW